MSEDIPENDIPENDMNIKYMAEYFMRKLYDNSILSNAQLLRDLNVFLSYCVIVCARNAGDSEQGKKFLEYTVRLYEEKQREMLFGFKVAMKPFVEHWDDEE
jgi:hypothetical protein